MTVSFHRRSFRTRDGVRSFPIAIIVATLLSLSPAATPLSDGAQIKGSARVAAAQEVGDVIELAPGVIVTVLASEAVDSLPDMPGNPISLSQVPLPPGSTMSEVLTDHLSGPPEGLQLLYVDVGELVVLRGSGETTYQRGDQLLIPS